MNQMSEKIMSVQGIGKSYGNTEALHNLSFEAGPGDIIGLLGPNGAGKTTAIRVLTTIFPPTHGEFTLDGIPHTQPSKIRKKIGALPESMGYPLRVTGEEYLVFFGRLFGISRANAQEKAEKLISIVGLSEHSMSQIATYSRGMRQRLGIARALINDPMVLFLDEPTLGFDPKGQREVLDIIRSITRQMDSSVILSTHFLEAVEHVCSSVIILKRGSIVANGTVAEIKRHVHIPRTGHFHVSPKKHDTAFSLIKKVPGVSNVRTSGSDTGSFLVEYDQMGMDSRKGTDETMNQVISALVEAHVPILSFSLQSASLSDAFLEITKEVMK